MSQENAVFYNPMNEADDDININFKKPLKAIRSRRWLLRTVFCSVLIFFILLTFILPKKYTVNANLYINKLNSSNMKEFNPYMFDDSGSGVMSAADKAINNEIELMKSELVLDKVIKENHIVYKKKYGIFPHKKEGELLTASDFYGKGKSLRIENLKNTNVISVKYTSKKPKLAYGVVSSLVNNYIDLHKEINIEKSKADKKILEAEYAKAKSNLNEKLNNASGLPSQAITGIGNISAMSAFSKAASSAMGNVKGQFIAGERSKIEIAEESQKVAHLASKIEWANMVELISDSSKVLVIEEPKLLRPFEYSSPKLIINIILGCIFGFFATLITFLFAELKSSKLTYLMLSNNIIFDGIKELPNLEIDIYSFNPQDVFVLSFEQLPDEMKKSLQKISNVSFSYYDGKKDFVDKISNADKIILISKINSTNADSYKLVRKVLQNKNKDLLYDILI